MNVMIEFIYWKFINCFRKNLYRHRLFPADTDYTDCANNRPDYEYGRLIGTALIKRSDCPKCKWSDCRDWISSMVAMTDILKINLIATPPG